MTDYSAVLKELMLAGYEGEHLLAAFRRMCLAIEGPVPGGAQSLEPLEGTVAAPNVVTFQDDWSPQGDILAPLSPSEPDQPDRSISADKLMAIARKQVGITGGLSGSAARVGAAILDHFNRKTGQCDPSIDGLAQKLSLCRRTIIRAIGDLDRTGLIKRVRHGGFSHRNAYLPNWKMLSSRTEIWDKRMADRGAPVLQPVSPLPPRGQDCHLQGVRTVTQTHITNPDIQISPRGTRSAQRPPNPRQREMLMPFPPSSSTAMIEAAKGRVSDAVRGHLLAIGKQHFVEVLPTIPADVWDAAYASDARRRGDGLSVVLRHLQGRAPPVAVAGR